MLDENNVLMSDEEFYEMVEKYTGVKNVHIMENTDDAGIQHIDCWLKILDEETLLVITAGTKHCRERHQRVFILSLLTGKKIFFTATKT